MANLKHDHSELKNWKMITEIEKMTFIPQCKFVKWIKLSTNIHSWKEIIQELRNKRNVILMIKTLKIEESFLKKTSLLN